MGWQRLLRGVRTLVRRRAVEREMDEEMRFHLDMEIAYRIANGMSPDVARQTARLDFGGVDRYKEEARERRPFAWIAQAWQDAAHALRLLRRFPGFSAAVVVVAALGVGSTTAIFSIVSGVLLEQLPFHEPDRLAALYLHQSGGDDRPSLSLSSFDDLARASGIVEAVGAYVPSNAALTSTPEPEQLRVERVTPSMFPLLGIPPALGRTFLPAENAPGARVAVLSHALWQRQFGGDSAIVGRTIVLDEAGYTVVGVMPPSYRGVRLRAPAIWLPMDLERARATGVSAVVRLRPGTTAREAQDRLSRSGLLRGNGAEEVPVTAELIPLAELLTGDVRTPLLVLLGAVGFVLALAGANIATLLLARASAREREMAVRRAVGATRARQMRQVLTESLVLVGLGGAIGVLLAWWSIAAMPAAVAGVLPRTDEIALDVRVLAVALAAVLCSGLMAGLAPAIVASRARPGEALQGGHADLHARWSWGGVRSGFVIAQVALSVCLLVGAGLMIKSFLTIVPRDPGFEPSGRIAMSIRLEGRPQYDSGGAARRLEFVREVSRRVGSLAGVHGVAATSFLPLVMMSGLTEVDPTGGSDAGARLVSAHQRSVTANYFDVMDIRLLRGRGFTADDRAGAERVVVVNETAARRWWPDGDAVGRPITYTERSGFRRGVERVRATVVGVIGDVRFSGLRTSANAELFVPYAQHPYTMMTFVVSVAGDPVELIPHVRDAVRQVDAKLPIDGIRPVDAIVRESVAVPRFYGTVLSVFAAIALVLALTGVFGVLAYAVSRRQREMGIRLALGAPRSSVTTLVLRQGMTIVLAGVVLGAMLARGVSRVLDSVLFEVRATDPAVFAMMIVLLTVAASMACLVPARRAARVDPLIAIKGD